MLSNDADAIETQDPFVPLAILGNALRYWWVVALLILAGGIGGRVLHSFRPPVYEASAEYAVAIDFVSTGPLTQYEEDLAINTAGNVFAAPDVLQQVADQATKEGIPTSLIDLKKKIFLERKFSVWTLRVRDHAPQVAERLAAIWMDVGEAVLQESYQHAIRADLLYRRLQDQENCIERLVLSEPVFVPCQGAAFPEVQKNLYDAGAALWSEKQASRGLFVGLILGPFHPPTVSQQPVRNDLNQFVFLGGLVGLIVSVIFLEFLAPKRIRRKR